MERNKQKDTESGEYVGQVRRNDGDQNADEWAKKTIGFLARHVLSEARLKAPGESSPGAAIAQAPGGVRASNEKRGGGGAVSVVTVLADLPIMPQQPPVAQTKGITTKDRAVTRSANG